MSDTPRTKNRFCPHCGSDEDPVLKSKMWSCGVYFSDTSFRTKVCFRRELTAAQADSDKWRDEYNRMRWLIAKQDQDISQTCGKALGYPWFKDDQKNFLGSTEEHGVCVGEHVAETIAAELADAYTAAQAEIARLKGDLPINTSERLFDLVRYSRSSLHKDGLISDVEYAWLCAGAPMATSQSGGSPSPRRLEEYDQMRQEIARLKAGGCARDQRTTQFCAEALKLQEKNAKLQERISLLERLVDGVHYIDGVHLEEMDGLNWFDARKKTKDTQ